jgi:hypothetical protein
LVFVPAFVWGFLAFEVLLPFVTSFVARLNFQACLPNKLTGARSFQFGRTSAPIAPQAVQAMRGPKEGTVTSPVRLLTSKID